MNKNKLIAIALDAIASQMKYIADLLDQPESVSAPLPLKVSTQTIEKGPLGDYIKDSPKTFSDNPYSVTDNLGTPKNRRSEPHTITAPTTSKASGNKVMEYYENKVAAGEWMPNGQEKYTVVHGETNYLKVISTTPARIYYKITFGPDRGAVLVVNRKTRMVVKDGRMTNGTKSNGQLALVSKDKDGLDYAQVVRNNLIARGYTKRQSQLVRFYRPNSAGIGNYKMAVIYRKNRYQGRP